MQEPREQIVVDDSLSHAYIALQSCWGMSACQQPSLRPPAKPLPGAIGVTWQAQGPTSQEACCTT